MALTVTYSTGPLVKSGKDVHIIKLPPKAVIVDDMGGHPSDAEVLAEAAKYVGKPALTDVVVFDHKPWHVVNGQLEPHPQVHTAYSKTILTLSFAAQERAVWWSEQPFRITRIERSSHHQAVAGSPDDPFSVHPPYDAQPRQDAQAAVIYVVESTPIVQRSIGQMYKINFNIGEDIDPDMSCGN